MTPAPIRDLFLSLSREPAFQELAGRLTRDRTSRASLSGLTETAKAAYLALLWRAVERPLVVVTGGNRQAEALAELTGAFHALLDSGKAAAPPQLIPAHDVLPAQRLSPHSEISEQRGVGLWRLASGETSLTIAPVASALLRTGSPDFYRQLALLLRAGEEVPLEEVVAHLESIGYERREPVEMVGEYSVRGGILDVFPADSSRPVRIELFGDEIESIRRFEVESQRSVLRIPEVTILPLVEFPRSRPLLAELAEKLEGSYEIPSPGDVFPGWELAAALARPRGDSLFSMAGDAVVVIDEPEQTASAAERLWKRLDEAGENQAVPPEANYFRWGELRAHVEGRAEIELRELAIVGEPGENALSIETRPAMSFQGNVPLAVKESRALVEQGYQVVFFAPSLGELERLADILREYSAPFQVAIATEEA